MTNPINDLSDGVKTLFDLASIVTVVGTIAKLLPPLAAAFSIVWLTLCITGDPRVQRLWARIWRRGG